MPARRPKRVAPIREVIISPSRSIVGRHVNAARQLQATIKGGPDIPVYVPGANSTHLDPQGFPVHDADIGNSNIQVGPKPSTLPKPQETSPRPMRQTPTTDEALAAYAQKINGGKPITSDSLAKWTAAQKFDYAEAVVALNTNDALGGLPSRLNGYMNAVSNLTMDNMSNARINPTGIPAVDQTLTGFYRMYQSLANPIRTEDAPRTTGDHAKTQALVGGTKGSTGIVDRSAANKKAWETRKKLYGSSGQKEK